MDTVFVQLAALRYFSWKRLVAAVLQALGVLWVVVQIATFFWVSLAASIRPLWWVFLGAGIVLGVVRAWPHTSVSAKIAGTDVTVTIRVGDLFAQPGDVVISSNTTFDTSLEDGTISPKSVQGQLLTRKLCNSVEHLDREIANALREVPAANRSDTDKPYGKRRSYPIGTVAHIQCNRDRRAYLLAIAALNANRVARGSLQDLLDALPRLWEHIRTNGPLEPLVTPVLGSGSARLQVPRENLVREIIRSFVAANRAGKFCEGLTIVLRPTDFRKGQYDLNELGRFLSFECEYSSAAADSAVSNPAGTAI